MHGPAGRFDARSVNLRRTIITGHRRVPWMMDILVFLSVWPVLTRSDGASVPVVIVARADGPGRPSAMTEVTRVLAAIEQGDPHAAEELLPLVYDELRKLAAKRLAQEKPGQTLQATALVHEAYLKKSTPG